MRYYALQVTLLLALIAAGCSNKQKDAATLEKEKGEQAKTDNHKKLESLVAMLQNGDMVARSGISWDSDQIRDFQVKDKLFTHVGIAKKTDSGWAIGHVTGRDSNNAQETVVYELIDTFLNRKRCSAIGLYRFNMDTAEANKLVAFIDECYDKKIRFDYMFDTRTDSAMTCSEMVMKGVTKVTNGRIAIGYTPIVERRHIQLIKRVYRKYRVKDSEIIGRHIIAVDDLTTNKDCKELARISYQ